MAHKVDRISFGAIARVRDRLLEQQRQGRTVLRLESGDPSFDLPPHVRAAMEKALADGQTHYTATPGILPLREAITEKVVAENKLGACGVENILVTNGAMHALYIAFQALIEPGDEVILPDPMWTEVGANIQLAGGVPVPVRLKPEEGYQYNPDEIEAAIHPRTRAIYLNTPHNPTGAVAGRETLLAIARLAERHDLMLLSDEAYEHVLFDGERHISLGSIPEAAGRTISVFSMSKTYAMSGLRLGYAVVPQAFLLERMQKLIRCTINGVNSVTQHGAAAALRGSQEATRTMAAEYQTRRDILYRAVQISPHLDPFLPHGAFYLWARILPDWPGYHESRDDWALTEYLIDQAALGSTPGSAFGPAGCNHIRFAFSCEREQVEQAASVLPGVLAASHPGG